MTVLDERQRRLLNRYQRELPLQPRPFAAMAEYSGMAEAELLGQLRHWLDDGVLSRIGAVVEHAVGASTLAALAVPASRIDEVAALVDSFVEVNHNYLREHAFNLWFVVTAPSRERVDAVLVEIVERSGLQPLELPMERCYRIDTGFAL